MGDYSEKFINRCTKFDIRITILTVDNCSAHPKISTLKSNTTSHIQPMDQAIINALKVHDRAAIVNHKIETNQSVSTITVLDALHTIHQAWKKVSPHTINKCFQHCGFTCQRGGYFRG